MGDTYYAYYSGLFDKYVNTLGREFHAVQRFDRAYEKCVSIAQTLLEHGFRIMNRLMTHDTEKLEQSSGAEQTIVIYTFDVALFAPEAVAPDEPLLRTSVKAKIFGPRTICT